MIQPARAIAEALRIVCFESGLEDLLAQLAVHDLDVVLSDRPLPAGLNVKAYSHALGECATSWFVTRTTARSRKAFPARLSGERCPTRSVDGMTVSGTFVALLSEIRSINS